MWTIQDKSPIALTCPPTRDTLSTPVRVLTNGVSVAPARHSLRLSADCGRFKAGQVSVHLDLRAATTLPLMAGYAVIQTFVPYVGDPNRAYDAYPVLRWFDKCVKTPAALRFGPVSTGVTRIETLSWWNQMCRLLNA
jgi:hypothetical protein